MGWLGRVVGMVRGGGGWFGVVCEVVGVGWLYSGYRSFEAKFPPASISLKTEGCRVEQMRKQARFRAPNVLYTI